MKSHTLVLRLLFALQTFVALGALPVGSLLIIDPAEPSIFKEGMLANTPFTSYLIPGILLFCVNGLGNVWAAWLSWRQDSKAAFSTILLGAFMLGWIGAQVLWFQEVSFLHVLFGSLGIIELGLGAWLWRGRQRVASAFG